MKAALSYMLACALATVAAAILCGCVGAPAVSAKPIQQDHQVCSATQHALPGCLAGAWVLFTWKLQP